MAPVGLSSCHRQIESDVSARRLFGVYYTPDDLATVLVRWALANGHGPVLDPSYGGCAFLEAAVRVLSEIHASNAGRQVYGVDIDPRCANTVRSSEQLVEANCFHCDFLTTTPSDLPGSPYAAIVGNPPYVRHHWIRGDQLESARAVAADSKIPLPATSSLWVYFLLHALRFLSPGGRLAMLVPEAILQTDYAAPLRETLANRFSRSLLVYVRDRLFAGTDEAVVAVACSGFGEKGDILTLAVESVEDLRSVLKNPDSNEGQLSYRFPTDQGECQNSNVVHSLTWKNDVLVTPEAVAVGFLTGAVSAWAELRGRRYGGGVLKIEPGILKRMPVPLVEGAEDVFHDLDLLLRRGEEEKARRVADERVLREGLGLGNHEIDTLQRTRSKLMEWRRPSRGDNGNG